MTRHPALQWATSWCASAQGAYPVGNASAQPVLDHAIPDPLAGVVDQTFRMVVKPTVWGRRARVRLSNAFGTQPLTLTGVYVGMVLSSACLIPGSQAPATFGGQHTAVLPPGAVVWSDPVVLPLVTDPDHPLLQSQKLAVSFAVVGQSGPMTWHAKAMGTSYLSAPGVGPVGHSLHEHALPFSTTSWFFVDALDMEVPKGTPVVVAMGDSITDGSASTLNGLDRWPDVLARQLQLEGKRVAVVNAGIGGNRVVGTADGSTAAVFPGGPPMVARLERDVLGLSGVTHVIWQEGTNDFSRTGDTPVDAVVQGMVDVVQRLRKAIPGVVVVGATLHSVLGSRHGNHGSAEQEFRRQLLNTFVREGGLFDVVADFDAATLNPVGPGMHPWFVPDSCTGGAGDGVHPNRAGHLAMAQAVEGLRL